MTPKRTMPQLRERIHEIADEIINLALDYDDWGLEDLANELHDIADESKRRFNGRKAPRDSDPVTPEKEAEVLELHRLHPDWSQRRIAQKANVSQGRVSEILNGKRGE